MKDSMKDQLRTLMEKGDLSVSEKKVEKNIVKKETSDLKNKDMSKLSLIEEPILDYKGEKIIEELIESPAFVGVKIQAKRPDVVKTYPKIDKIEKSEKEKQSNRTNKLLLIGVIIIAVSIGVGVIFSMSKKTSE